MFKSRRRVALGITAAASVACMIALAVPAQAIVPATPSWPVAGRVPAGCDPVVTFTSSTTTAWTYTYTDSSVPSIVDARVSAGATNITVLTPTGADVKVWGKFVDSCGGVGGALMDVSRNGALATGAFLANTTSDAFSSWWSGSLASGIKHPDDAGVWKAVIALTGRRYDSFVLDQDFKYVSSVSGTGSFSTSGPWATKPSYLLRATTITNTLSATKIAKGKTVKTTAVLKRATNAGYVGANGDKVAVQTKVGAGTWVTNATLTANASGAVTYSFVLTATTQVRFVHPRTLSGNFTEGITSIIKTVKRA